MKTKTWLRKNIKTGSNRYGAGYQLYKDGEVVLDKRGYGLKKEEIVEEIYNLQGEIDFDKISIHSPSATGVHDTNFKLTK